MFCVLIWCEHTGMWLLASCSFLVPLFSFRYQSLNLTHVQEHSMPIYEFRWYPPAGRGDFDWHCPRDLLMEGRWTDQSCQGCTYQYSLAKGREQWKEGGIDKEQGHRPTVFPSLPFSTLHQLGSINSTFSLVVFSSPLFLHSASCFWSYFSSFHHVENAFHFSVGNPPPAPLKMGGGCSSLKFKYKVWYCILICLNELMPDWDWPSYRVGKQSWKDGSP